LVPRFQVRSWNEQWPRWLGKAAWLRRVPGGGQPSGCRT